MPLLIYDGGGAGRAVEPGLLCRKLSNPEETIWAESGACPEGWAPAFTITSTAIAPRCDWVCILAIVAAAWVLARN